MSIYSYTALALAVYTGAVNAATSLWTPSAQCTFDISLSEVYSPYNLPSARGIDIDLFDVTVADIAAYHAAGKKVLCYFSAGTYENWRPDASQFTAADKGKNLADWPGEAWINVNSANVRNIMAARIKMANDKGCDAIDPDNIDGYDNPNGIGLTQNDAVNYMKFLSSTALTYNLSTGLKNAAAIIPKIINNVHFVVNEQCHQYSECAAYLPFIAANKPVINIEYNSGLACPKNLGTDDKGFTVLEKNLSLDVAVKICKQPPGEAFVVVSSTSVATSKVQTSSSSSSKITTSATPVKTSSSSSSSLKTSTTTTSNGRPGASQTPYYKSSATSIVVSPVTTPYVQPTTNSATSYTRRPKFTKSRAACPNTYESDSDSDSDSDSSDSSDSDSSDSSDSSSDSDDD